MIEAFGGATPEDVADGARGENGAEVTLDQDLAGGRQEEQRLDHGTIITVAMRRGGGCFEFLFTYQTYLVVRT